MGMGPYIDPGPLSTYLYTLPIHLKKAIIFILAVALKTMLYLMTIILTYFNQDKTVGHLCI